MSEDRSRLYRRLPVPDEASWWQRAAAAAPDGRVLHLACGSGRLSLAMARHATELVAVDRDPRLLEAFGDRLRQEPAIAGRVRLVEARPDELSLGERFGLVVIPSQLTNGIADPSARTSAIRQAARHCLPAGRVVIQALNPYWLASSDPAGTGTVAPRDGGPGIDVSIEDHGFDAWEQRRVMDLTYRFADGATLTDRVDATALYPRELRALVYQAGLEITEQWGAEPGSDPLDAHGGTWHLVCRARRG